MDDLESQLPKKRKFHSKEKNILRALLGVALAAVILIATIDPKEMIKRQDGVYWARFAIMAVSTILFSWNLVFSISNARNNGVGIRFPSPGQWWPVYYKEMPEIKYFGTPLEVIGLAIGLAQTILSIISFVYLQEHDKDPITFSLLPVIYSAMALVISIFPRVFEPVYKVTTTCGGRRHTFIARAENGTIEGECKCQQNLEGTSNRAATERDPAHADNEDVTGNEGEDMEEKEESRARDDHPEVSAHSP